MHILGEDMHNICLELKKHLANLVLKHSKVAQLLYYYSVAASC